MIDIINASDRHVTDMGWLKTYWLFSFSNYYDPANVSHGSLRVFNDDVVQGRAGFGTHPHEEMEIISIILDGEIAHKDTMGNETVIRPNDVQRMTAGTGLYHSEKNKSSRPVHFYQIWIIPDKPGLAPSYDQKSFDPDIWQNRLALLASDRYEDSVVTLNTEADLYRSALYAGKSVSLILPPGSKAFVYLIRGAVTLNEHVLRTNDQARIGNTGHLEIFAAEAAEFILIRVPT